jgi:release factor glutamine methyltransferase
MESVSDTRCAVGPADARVADLLARASETLAAVGIPTSRLDAEVLLAWVCGVERAQLYARLREPVAATAAATFATLLARRTRREPLQYIVGHQEFWSLDFLVTRDVLIPRPETELLVETTLRALRRRGGAGHRVSLCDVGTGSGCVAVALARELPHASVWALDVSHAALRVAASNARRHGVAGRVRLLTSDLFAAVPLQQFDAIIANPPYVAFSELVAAPPELRWEPRTALDGGPAGLAVIERLVHDARTRARDAAPLVMEIGAGQADAVTALAQAAGWAKVSVLPDYAGLPRVAVLER